MKIVKIDPECWKKAQVPESRKVLLQKIKIMVNC